MLFLLALLCLELPSHCNLYRTELHTHVKLEQEPQIYTKNVFQCVIEKSLCFHTIFTNRDGFLWWVIFTFWIRKYIKLLLIPGLQWICNHLCASSDCLAGCHEHTDCMEEPQSVSEHWRNFRLDSDCILSGWRHAIFIFVQHDEIWICNYTSTSTVLGVL